jgi:acylphosphatase
MSAMIYHIFVSGRVQGVGYRRFAQKQADDRKLEGWTRNLLDGRVEVLARGTSKELDDYCEALKKGPSFSLVRDVIVKELETMDDLPKLPSGQFEILPDVELK